MSLYEIVKSLQNAQGSLAKQAILLQHKDDTLLKSFMKATYDPSINYYQKKLRHSDLKTWKGSQEFYSHDINFMLDIIAGRKVTGLAAEASLNGHVSALNEEGRELFQLMLNRSIGASIGDTMVLKTWPDLYFIPSYMRCSLLDDKAKERFSKLSRMLIQPKMDGSYITLIKESGKSAQAITRAGNSYPQWFSDKLAEGVFEGSVLIGECLVWDGDKVLDRQTGNGILNSILKNGDDTHYEVKMTVWDMVHPEQFKVGYSDEPYNIRLQRLNIELANTVAPNIQMIETYEVQTIAEAYEYYSRFTASGLEGAVLKKYDAVFKAGTSKDCVKMKVEFEIDLKITGVVEGSGKASGMMGALQLTSSCGKLVTDVGTGFTDDMRVFFWLNRDVMIGNIVTVKANDIISKRDRNTKSLFLPVWIEERHDKTEADSLEQCEKILASAKGLK